MSSLHTVLTAQTNYTNLVLISVDSCFFSFFFLYYSSDIETQWFLSISRRHNFRLRRFYLYKFMAYIRLTS